MLNRTGLLRLYPAVLLSGVMLLAGEAMSAQTTVKNAAKPAQPVSASPVEPTVNFVDVVRVVEQQGRGTSIGSYIAEAVGLKNTQTDTSPVGAHAVDDSDRELCVIEDSDALLFLIAQGENTMVYLSNRAGTLQMAGYFHPGRFHSQDFKEISKQKAAAGFAAEKEFWLRRTFPSKYVGAAPIAEPVSTPETAKPNAEAVAKPTKKVESKESKKAAAPAASTPAATPTATTPTANTAAKSEYGPEKLRQMTPKERIKYLDQQIEEAKRQEKLEKKKAKGKKSAEKDSQPSNAEGDAPPQKKKTSWF